MKVLVTGGAGFIGSHTVDLLVEKGFEVLVLDNFEPQVHNGRQPEYLNENATYLRGTVTRLSDWLIALKQCEAVIHLAAMVGVGQSMYNPLKYIRTNSIGTTNIFEVLLKKPEIRKRIKKVVVASSKSIYGEGSYRCLTHGTVYPQPRPLEQLKKKDWEVKCPFCSITVQPVGITEEKPVQNLSVYALSKYDTERISVELGKMLDIPVVALRYFNVYGPRQSLSNPYTGVLAIFLSRIKNGNSPVIFEDGKQMRDFVFVKDVARANLMALETEKSGVYNVGSGVPQSILQMAQLLVKLSGSSVEPVVTKEYRFGDNRHDYADISKIKRELGFEPRYSLDRGLKELIDWGETQEAHDYFERAEAERKKYFSIK